MAKITWYEVYTRRLNTSGPTVCSSCGKELDTPDEDISLNEDEDTHFLLKEYDNKTELICRDTDEVSNAVPEETEEEMVFSDRYIWDEPRWDYMDKAKVVICETEVS